MSIGTNLLCLRSTARWKSCYYSNAVSLDLNAIFSWYRYRCPIPDICCRYLIRFSLCYYSNAVSLDLNAICSWYRYRYPIPDTSCRYLARCSFFHSSICLCGSFSSSSSSLLPRNGSSCCFILCHFWTSEETFRALDESREVPTLEDCGKKKRINIGQKVDDN